MRPAIFLDRDGVLIENRAGYVRSWPDVEFFPYTFDAMRAAAKLPHAFFIVSNQAGVGRGLIDYATAEAINNRVADEINAAGGRIDRAYFCPHRKDDNCACRKPAPGMLLRAARDYDIDLAQSWMIGDNITDMQAARAAGTRCILVRTGLGAEQIGKRADAIWFPIADTLPHALAMIARSL
jgi:histidinol-phosphate phosphatase family protein